MAVEEGGDKAIVAVGGLYSPPHPREHQWQAWVDAHVPGACVLNLYGPCFHETFYILHTLAGLPPPPLVVLSGHAASLTPYLSNTPRPSPRTNRTRRRRDRRKVRVLFPRPPPRGACKGSDKTPLGAPPHPTPT
jgi:hypothetical protein